MSAMIALDVLVAGLLAATIGYAVVLNRRLRQLRDGRDQMERLIADFRQATTRAEVGLTALKETAGQTDGGVLAQLDSVRTVRDELEFLIGRAEAESARLEDAIRRGRATAGSSAPDRTAALAPDAGLDAELFGAPPHTPAA